MKKIIVFLISGIVILFLLFSIYSHTESYYKFQLRRAIMNINSSNVKLTPYSDENAVKELIEIGDIKNIKIDQITKDNSSPNPAMVSVVTINGDHKYRIIMRCYVYPLNFQIIKNWQLNQINNL